VAARGIEVDPGQNAEPTDRPRRISPDGSASRSSSPTDEEVAIARQVRALLG